MIGNKKEPQRALNKAFLNIPPDKSEFEVFKKHLNTLISHFDNTESEEHIKTLLRDFLKDSFYKTDYFINTKGRADLVIHNDSTNKSPVAVLFEIKKPANKTEMITIENLNCKAFHEIILYFLRERIEHENIDLKQIIITNLFDWFIFDSSDFERLFINSTIRKEFDKWNKKELVSSKTDLFYNEIIKPFIENSDENIDYIHFNLKEDYNETDLISMFKLLSPKNLLKQIFTNDNNVLNKDFYYELLHIIGLEEVNENGKQIIKRKKEKIEGTLIENTITQIKIRNDLDKIETLEIYGDSESEQLFNISLELNITWINRILFLKLLESQLVLFHNGDSDFHFLHNKRITGFGQIEKLFFQVLAKKYFERDDKINQQYAKIPYLNSSLFEPTDLEKQSIFISQLDSDSNIPIFKNTVLKDNKGVKRFGECGSLQYLLEFLDAYNFTSEPAAVFTENTNTLINAAVLGLIFEKINGYKEGAFFTPGYITMYMCRQTIRRAVLDKFRPILKLSENSDFAESWKELYNKIDNISIQQANEIVDSIKICDPSVGSGHFLVSALNEIICIKSDLRILCNKDGKKIRDYQIKNVRDELEILDENNKYFLYKVNKENKPNAEKQNLQETIFNEKQRILENCIYGVDINPNSVNITRLRLWIELLKHAYYTEESNFTELKTLPNIDINIKQGNSLFSRFNLSVDLKEVFKNGYNVTKYLFQTEQYLTTSDSNARKHLKKQLDDTVEVYAKYIVAKDPYEIKINKLNAELMDLTNPYKMFNDDSHDYQEQRKLRLQNLNTELANLYQQKKETDKLNLQRKSFEWRIQFAKLLDLKTAEFKGFDIIIGNPPYIKEYDSRRAFDGLRNLPIYQGKMDLWYLFGARGIELLNDNGYLCYIAPNNWTTNAGASKFRNYIIQNTKFIEIIDFGSYFVFDSSDIQTMIMLFQKNKIVENYTFDYRQITIKKATNEIALKALNKENTPEINYLLPTVKSENLLNKTLHFANSEIDIVLEKIQKQKNFSFYEKSNKKLKIVAEVGNGIHPHHDKVNKQMLQTLGKEYHTGQGIFVLSKEELKNIKLNEKEKKLIKPCFSSKELKRYHQSYNPENWIIYTESKFKKASNIKPFPNIKAHLDKFQNVITSDNKPYGLHRCREEHLFTGEKIFAIRKCEKPTFTYSDKDTFALAEFYVIKTKRIDLKFLTGLLNSKLIEFWLFNRGKMQGNIFQVDKEPIMNLPIINVKNKYTDKIIENVDKILQLKNENVDSDITGIENEINLLVYKLYNLNYSDVILIDNEIAISQKQFEKL